jgi:hypothetical protein
MAPANTGPGVVPSMNHGNLAAARSSIKNGLDLLGSALPNIPMGSPLYTDLLTAISKIAKHMTDDGPADRGLQASGMMQAMKTAQAQGPQIQALRSLGGGIGMPQQPPAMPATPPPM